MIRTVQSRRVVVVVTMAIVALQWLGPSLDVHAAERGQSASEKRAEGHSATERQGKVIQVSADLTHDIDRLETRGTQSEIYDLFSGPAQASSAGRSKNKPSGKEDRSSGQSARPPADSAHEPVTPIADEPAPVAVSAVQPTIQELPPEAPPIVAAPPPPKPPAVPFVYMGKLTESDRTVYFLVKADKLYMVRPGDEIDESYVFEGEAGNQIKLTYKPLRVAQTLTMMGP
jgi:hypothetical protein